MAENIPNVTSITAFEAEVIDARKQLAARHGGFLGRLVPAVPHAGAPTVAEIAQDYTGRLKVVKMNAG